MRVVMRERVSEHMSELFERKSVYDRERLWKREKWRATVWEKENMSSWESEVWLREMIARLCESMCDVDRERKSGWDREFVTGRLCMSDRECDFMIQIVTLSEIESVLVFDRFWVVVLEI